MNEPTTTNGNSVRPMTLGEYRVGIDFNVSNSPEVNAIKRACADLIDLCDMYSKATDNPEARRVFALAMTHFEEGAMDGLNSSGPVSPGSFLGDNSCGTKDCDVCRNRKAE